MKIEKLCVAYGETKVYENFNLEIGDSGVTCLLGESGCGKTTILNAIARLIPYTGEITPVKVSYVFQTPRLVPNLTVLTNLTLIGVEENKAKNMLERVGLKEKVNAYPKTLSGGEQQRVSLCRAFLYPSKLLLLDEPFSSLDLKTKIAAMDLFKSLQASSGTGTLFVTHDIDEACYLADRIIVLKGGRVAAEFDNSNRKPFGANSEIRESLIQTLLK
ncbi:MAG: ABC transporter ATP-binding protein [Candidatus Coproplasma sp.]